MSTDSSQLAALLGVGEARLHFDGVGESGVTRYRLDGACGRYWCRVHRDERRYRTERDAYVRIGRSSFDRGPTLVEHFDVARTLVLSHVEGRPVRPGDLDLHAWIDVIEAIRAVTPGVDPLPLAHAVELRRRAVIADLEALGESAAAASLAALGAVADAARVFAHRDLAARNLLEHNGRLRVVDFEHAQDDAPETDMLRIVAEEPSMEEGLVRHFCRDSASRERLVVLNRIERARELAWGLRHRDPARVDRARAFLSQAAADEGLLREAIGTGRGAGHFGVLVADPVEDQ